MISEKIKNIFSKPFSLIIALVFLTNIIFVFILLQFLPQFANYSNFMGSQVLRQPKDIVAVPSISKSPVEVFIVPLAHTGKITAAVETTPVVACGATECDAADDPAIWIHPTDVAKSLIIGTDKQSGLEVYDLQGVKLQVISNATANVDVRYNFPFSGQKVDIVATYNNSSGSFSIYKVNPNTQRLEDITGLGQVRGGGTALYVSPVSGKYYYLSNFGGVMSQYELTGNNGKVNASLVRSVSFGSGITEGIVADDVLKNIYISEESVHSVWKIPAEPQEDSAKTLVDSLHLAPDTEGLTIYYKSDETGYLLVSNQGADIYNIYKREGNNEYIGSFTIENGQIDGVSHTDGIDVVNLPLGNQFPYGVFVAQDDVNEDDGIVKNQNFKLAPWELIAGKFNLSMDTSWDPRRIGK